MNCNVCIRSPCEQDRAGREKGFLLLSLNLCPSEFLPIVAPSSTFKPVHQQPVTLQQLIELEPELLTAGATDSRALDKLCRTDVVLSTEASRLQNSLNHLERSNREIAACLQDDESSSDFDQSERDEMKASIEENEGVM